MDEMVVKIRGKRMWLRRAVDDEGEVLDAVVQKRRNTKAALRLLRKLLKNQGIHPETFTTDKLASYGAALRKLGCGERHRPGQMLPSNRAENSHLVIRRRERKQQKINTQCSPNDFLSTHAAVYNTFNTHRHVIHRSTSSESKPIGLGRPQLSAHWRLCPIRFTAALASLINSVQVNRNGTALNS